MCDVYVLTHSLAHSRFTYAGEDEDEEEEEEEDEEEEKPKPLSEEDKRVGVAAFTQCHKDLQALMLLKPLVGPIFTKVMHDGIDK
jgi:hypothetical protein